MPRSLLLHTSPVMESAGVPSNTPSRMIRTRPCFSSITARPSGRPTTVVGPDTEATEVSVKPVNPPPIVPSARGGALAPAGVAAPGVASPVMEHAVAMATVTARRRT